MLCCVLALLPVTWLWLATGDVRPEDGPGKAPAAPVALVFGAGLWDGEPSPYLAHRLDAAAALYEQGKVRAILVTGDNSTEAYDEPGAMRTYLAERGVPKRRITADYAGFDTWDSCARARRIFGVEHALLVSQDFHVRRATALCRAAGVESYAVGVREPRDVTWLAGGAREVLSAVKAAYEAAVRPDPQFLGPQEPGVRRALADDRR